MKQKMTTDSLHKCQVDKKIETGDHEHQHHHHHHRHHHHHHHHHQLTKHQPSGKSVDKAEGRLGQSLSAGAPRHSRTTQYVTLVVLVLVLVPVYVRVRVSASWIVERCH